ncbi:MAG: HdeA/HdeB family chaperone [Xanthobacteraceae bacterium]
MKTLTAVVVAVALAAASPAHAQKLDLSEVSCKQFLESKVEHMSLILMWIAGYYADEDDPPIVDFDKMKTDATKLAEYCAKNPETGLVTAIEETIATDN